MKATPPQVAVDDRPGCAFGTQEIGCGIAFALAVVFVCDRIEPAQDEAGYLRWLRVAADHPIRCALAAALLAFAIRPTAVRPDRSGSPPDDRDPPP